MNCKQVENEVVFFTDPGVHSDALESHLTTCPLCRDAVDAYRSIGRELRVSRRYTLPVAAERSIREALAQEIAGPRRRSSWLSTAATEWLQMRLMPAAIGTLASLTLGLGVLGFLFSSATSNDPAAAEKYPGQTSVLLAGGTSSTYNDSAIFPADYARGRLAVAADSPSVNPQGSLIKLTGSMRPTKTQDGLVIVADVMEDGLAKIREVVTPVKDSRTINELQKAMDTSIGDSPFVPASMDNRSDRVRVVLRFQRVDVDTRSAARR